MTKTPLWLLFRLTFVLFSLFIMGDAFYRWDGFNYYASFSEFIPAVALVFIQWSLVSVVITFVLWLAIKFLYYAHALLGFRIKFDHLLLYSALFALLGAGVWKGKKLLFPLIQMPLPVKIIILLSVVITSFILARKFGDLFSRFLLLVHERITPLVWLFGAIFFLSIPIVSYHAWFKGGDKAALEKTAIPSESEKERPNIILVTFDALTARDMSLYGYHRETTPFIRKWAKGASVFTRVEAESTITTSTIASLMTGKRLWTHQTYHQGSPIQKKRNENIVRKLKQNGYHTMAYVENGNASPESLGINDSFDKLTFRPEDRGFLLSFHTGLARLFQGKIRLYDWLIVDDFYPTSLFLKYLYEPVIMPIYIRQFPEKEGAYSTGYTLLDKFISDFDKSVFQEPFFAWIHLLPPHSPYVPPKSFQKAFEPSQDLTVLHEQVKTFSLIKKLDGDSFTGSVLRDMKILRARYDEHILFCDREFEDFIYRLEKRKLPEDSVIILSADHGESFEHNHLAHGDSPYEPVVHIPLVIKRPEQKEGQVFHDIIAQIDISASIMDFAGVPLPSWLEGRSLSPLVLGGSLPPRPALTMYLQKNPSRDHRIANGFLNVYEGDYKLIYYIEEDRPLLFNLKEDPDEINNLFNKEPETGRRLLDFITDSLEKVNKRIESGT